MGRNIPIACHRCSSDERTMSDMETEYDPNKAERPCQEACCGANDQGSRKRPLTHLASPSMKISRAICKPADSGPELPYANQLNEPERDRLRPLAYLNSGRRTWRHSQLRIPDSMYNSNSYDVLGLAAESARGCQNIWAPIDTSTSSSSHLPRPSLSISPCSTSSAGSSTSGSGSSGSLQWQCASSSEVSLVSPPLSESSGSASPRSTSSSCLPANNVNRVNRVADDLMKMFMLPQAMAMPPPSSRRFAAAYGSSMPITAYTPQAQSLQGLSPWDEFNQNGHDPDVADINNLLRSLQIGDSMNAVMSLPDVIPDNDDGLSKARLVAILTEREHHRMVKRGGCQTVRVGRQGRVCVFCRNNGEAEATYTSHQLKDVEGRITCPVLYIYTCPICGANGSKAHTIKYCPHNGDLARSLRLGRMLRRD